MKDTIIHNTHHKFKLWDRIKILFGKELTVCSEIETEHEDAKLTGNVKCRIIVNKFKIFQSKTQGAGYSSENSNND